VVRHGGDHAEERNRGEGDDEDDAKARIKVCDNTKHHQIIQRATNHYSSVDLTACECIHLSLYYHPVSKFTPLLYVRSYVLRTTRYNVL
jgi:hypothetical protein